MPATAATAPAATPGSWRRSGPGSLRPVPKRTGNRGPAGRAARGPKPTTDDHEILFQKFFKSVGPRTYAAQVKRATNSNHYLVLMEGKRDEKTGDVRKTRLFVYSEDFVEFFRLVKSTAEFIKANPVPEEVRSKRTRFWERQRAGTPPAKPVAPAGASSVRA